MAGFNRFVEYQQKIHGETMNLLASKLHIRINFFYVTFVSFCVFVVLYYYSDKQGLIDHLLTIMTVVGCFVITYIIFRIFASTSLDNKNKKEVESLEKEIDDLTRPQKEQFEWGVNIEPYNPPIKHFSQALVAITVKNGDTAKNCLVQIDKLLNSSTKALIEEFSPIILKWDGYSDKDKEKPLDIRNGQTRRVALCASPQKNPDKTPGDWGLHIIWTSNVPANTKLNYDMGDYLARVKLTGDGIDPPAIQWFEISAGVKANDLIVEKSAPPAIPELIIDYKIDNDKYCYRVSGEQLHRIYIYNTTDRTIENCKVEITDMKERHLVFTRKLPTLKSFNINPGKELIDVIKWVHNRGLQDYEFIEFSPTMQTSFGVLDKDYEITITVSGENTDPISQRFKFGIKKIVGENDIFWFYPILSN